MAMRSATFSTRRIGALLFAMAVALAACGGGGGDGGAKGYVEPKGASTETISIDAQNFSFTPDKITAKPGVATIALTAKSGIHDLVFDGAYSGFRLEADSGSGTQKLKIDLKPGKYTFYCSYPGHRQAGMEGTLTVS
jgi:plastocyanin